MFKSTSKIMIDSDIIQPQLCLQIQDQNDKINCFHPFLVISEVLLQQIESIEHLQLYQQNLKQHQSSILRVVRSAFCSDNRIILQIFYKLRMGNSYSSQQTTCRLIASVSTCLDSEKNATKKRTHTLAPIFIQALQNKLTLADFQSSLTESECFYVLSTLLQQYYHIFRQQSKALVCLHLCIVNQLGEVKVLSNFQREDVDNLIYAMNFVSVLSHILQMVQLLAEEKEWNSNGQCGYFHHRILKTIYRFHSNDELLFQQLMGEVFNYMEYNQYKINLLPAIIRRTHPQQQPLLQRNQSHKRYQSGSFQSFAKRERQRTTNLSILTKKQSPISLHSRQNDQKSTVYHRKMAWTEGEEYFHSASNQNHLNQAQSVQIRTTARDNNRNYISSQYSVNITNLNRKNSQNVKSKVKFKKIAHKLQYEHEIEDHIDKALKRNNTINEIYCPQESKHTYTKSVLEDLARSVIVRDEPSSKSFIF